MKHIILLILLLWVACQTTTHQNQKIWSKSKCYYFQTSVNRTNASKDDYADVVLHVFDSAGSLIDIYNTRAGDFNKWAVGWDLQGDTIVLYSADIGTQAWQIINDSLSSVQITDALESRAEQIKTAKYAQ